MENKEQSQNEVDFLNPFFKDVLTLDVLLKPTLKKAIFELSENEFNQLITILIPLKELMNRDSHSLYISFDRYDEYFIKIYRFGPLWRFIFGRVVESVKDKKVATKNDLSILSSIIENIFIEINNIKSKKAV